MTNLPDKIRALPLLALLAGCLYAAPLSAAGGASSYYPPLAKSKTPAAAPSIDSLYNPEKQKSDAPSKMDEIKKRYEDMLVNYLFLKKCGQAEQSDWYVITSALAEEMASVNAPGRMHYDILTAAQGAYKEMYAGTPCDNQGVSTLHKQYAAYLEALKKNYPAP